MPPKYPKAVLFDLDGTLVSSSLDFLALSGLTGCVPGQDILRYVEGLPEAEQVRCRHIIHEHEMRDAQSCEVLPGVHDVLDNLSQMGVFTAILTRNSATATTLKLERTGVKVDHVLTREDAPPKPSPDGLLNLAQRWQLEVGECIYIGDYKYDLEAAKNAKMHSALFVENDIPDYAELANFIFHHYDEFDTNLRHYWESKKC